ncbi:hypothetical protein USDA257_p00660 (plasmid) [Sinorhizobium fredii USDA 257]|uniref:Uncharacterized protein n=1 Tax=Sinorhizobium fredii (strain USDA 257) TaxID=1185652 RepID=I3XFX8_SINF2|nr:hypothetical protein USDA257_p00660 [Sinorhizobium fredii USDA 257]
MEFIMFEVCSGGRWTNACDICLTALTDLVCDLSLHGRQIVARPRIAAMAIDRSPRMRR